MEPFDINSLIDDVIMQKEKHHSVYEKILIKVYKKIKVANKRRRFTILYEVPNYLFGHALYNTRECIVFLLVALRKKGLYVKYKNPNILIISWSQAMKNNYVKKAAERIDNRKNYQQNNYNIMNGASTFTETKKLKNHYTKMNSNLIKNFEEPKRKQDFDTISNAPSDINFHLNKLSGLKEMSKYY